MPQFRVGCVPYVNAVPLVWHFERLGDDSPVAVAYDVPSRLPRMLESGEVDAVLVSSYYALTKPGATYAGGVCIGSEGPVESVRLLSKVPYGEIETLALDASSMTSNALAQLVLDRQHGVRPQTVTMPPNGEDMLKVCDACVVIGDIGMTTVVPGARVCDLGEAWTDMTGLPFVWALWTALGEFPSALGSLLTEAYDLARSDSESWEGVLTSANGRVGWTREAVERYLTRCVRFQLDGAALQGLERFSSALAASQVR